MTSSSSSSGSMNNDDSFAEEPSRTIHNGCVLQWHNVSKTVLEREQSQGLLKSSISKTTLPEEPKQHPKKVILNQVSGMAHPGQVLAIMGPSGSGKTTLLDVLAGRRSHDDGAISIHPSNSSNITTQEPPQQQGEQLHQPPQHDATTADSSVKHFRRKIAYITQTDTFFGHLTVRDQLTYTALLRLPKQPHSKQSLKVVENVLQTFGLEKCADTQIRLLSGGEKKRVNIGTELLTNPTLVLLDEPTTGLDSTSAKALLQMLRNLALRKNKTIVTSLHQPNSSMYQTMFDAVLWIADGCVVYHDHPMESISYLNKMKFPCPPGYNVADHMMDLLVVNESDHQDEVKELQQDVIENGEASSQLHLNNEQEQESPTRRRSSLVFLERLSQRNKATMLESQLRSSFMNLISKGTTKSILIQAWKNHQTSEPSLANTQPQAIQQTQHDSTKSKKTTILYNTSWWTQFVVLTHRSMKNSRSAIFTTLNVVKSVCLGILTGLLWFQMDYSEEYVPDISSYYFFTMTFWIFDSLFGALFAFPEERTVILKERASGSYHLSAYFMAKTLSEAPVTLALPFIYLAISYWMTNVNTNFAVFAGTLGIHLMGVISGESIGLLVGATVHDFEQAMALLVVISVSLMVAGGYYIDNIPSFMEWFQYLSPFTYTYNGSVQLVFDRNVPCDGSQVLEVVCATQDSATPNQVLDFLGVNGTVAFNTVMLFVLIVAPRTLAFWALKLNKGGERS